MSVDQEEAMKTAALAGDEHDISKELFFDPSTFHSLIPVSIHPHPPPHLLSRTQYGAADAEIKAPATEKSHLSKVLSLIPGSAIGQG